MILFPFDLTPAPGLAAAPAIVHARIDEEEPLTDEDRDALEADERYDDFRDRQLEE